MELKGILPQHNAKRWNSVGKIADKQLSTNTECTVCNSFGAGKHDEALVGVPGENHNSFAFMVPGLYNSSYTLPHTATHVGEEVLGKLNHREKN